MQADLEVENEALKRERLLLQSSVINSSCSPVPYSP
jgi:hypothetical protein